MTLKEFLENYLDPQLEIEVTDSWYVDQETFCFETTVGAFLVASKYSEYGDKIVDKIDIGTDLVLMIRVKKQ